MSAPSPQDRPKRQYQRSGLHRSVRGSYERVVSEMPDLELTPDELEVRRWRRRAVRERGGRLTAAEEIQLRVICMEYLKYLSTTPYVEEQARKRWAIDKRHRLHWRWVGEHSNAGDRLFRLCKEWGANPPELKRPDVDAFVRDPSKPWNRRERAEGTAQNGHGAGQAGADRDGDHASHTGEQQVGPERPEETTWSV